MSDSSLKRRCTLVLPGLLDLPASDRESAFLQVGRLAELECFFSRASSQLFPGTTLDAVMFALFDVAISTDKDLPVAAVSCVADGGQVDDWCVRADPVQLIPDRDQLVLRGPESLSLSQTEADQLTVELNQQFAEDGWRVEACTPTHWYLHQSTVPELRTYSLAQVRGHAIGNYLPKGTDGKQWHRLMNEVQMVLHTSEVNQKRLAAGQVPVSSLWFWGGGKVPAIKSCHEKMLYSDEPVSRGLAILSNTAINDAPENAKMWLNASIAPGEHVLVMDGLLRCWQNGETENWLEQVKIFNRDWITPLLDALRQQQIDELIIYGCNGHKFTLTRSELKRWWRRKKSLAAVLAGL